MLRIRITAVLAAVCLCAPLSGCAPTGGYPSPLAPDVPNDTSSALTAYRDQYDTLPAFSALSAEQQTNYDALFTAVIDNRDRDTVVQAGEEDGEEQLRLRVELPHTLASGTDITALYDAFIADNPQFFYIGSTYTYEGYKVGNRAQYNVLYLSLTMTAAERQTASVLLEDAIAVITAGLDDATDMQKELAIHDRLIARCSYHTQAADSTAPDTAFPSAFTAYGALVDGKAVCEGYARAFTLLCRRVGLSCVPVTGIDIKENTAHMWNMVTVDGEPYHVDTTWDDQLDTALHVYYNLTTEEISRTHRLDADSAGRDCTATAAGYYRATGRYQEKYNRDTIAKAVADAVITGATTVELQFPTDKLPSIGLFVKNRTWFSESVNAYLPDGLRMWSYTYYVFSDNGVLVWQRQE